MVKIEDAALVNLAYDQPPYLMGTKVIEFETTAVETFVRVHGPGNQARNWVMRETDLTNLNPLEIAKKYNLPQVPSKVSKVTIPSGVRMRTGIVGPNGFGDSARAVQFEISLPSGRKLPDEWLQELRDL